MTAVLNLTTDNAPTRPKDKANEDLTTAIKEATLIETSKIVFPNPLLDENEFPYLINIYLKKRPPIVEARSISNPSRIVNFIP